MSQSPKYRYARANGEVLPSKILTNVDVNPQNFTAEEAYDLKKVLAPGSNKDQNSFVTTSGPENYYDAGEALLAWWRLDKEILASSTIADSSGKSNTLSPNGIGGGVPSLASTTPTNYIQKKSNNFFRDALQGSASSNFSFGNGYYDSPFSISAWVNFDTVGGSNYPAIASKFLFIGGDHTTREWALYYNPSGVSAGLLFYLQDGNGGVTLQGIRTGPLSSSTWYHIVATYDGRGGAFAYQGMNIYINGVLSTEATIASNADYVAMANTSTPVVIGNGYDGTADSATSMDYDFDGDIAEVAMWRGELSQDDVTALYNVKTAGAYRLVRDFKQVSPENDTRLTGIQTRSRGVDLSGLPSDMLEGYRQGINVNTYKQLDSFTSFKMRANSSFITTLNGVDVSHKAFDESFATTAFSSGSKAVSRVSFGGTGRLGARISHERENRDLGQSDVYVNHNEYEIYEDTLDLNPLGIVSTNPNNLVFPRQLVVQTSNELNDGAIEPLIIRKKIDHTSIEAPFFAHDFRASLGGMEDAFRRSMVLVDGKELNQPSCAPFLDSTETFGSIDLPGAFSTDFSKILPFVDYLNDRDKEYTTNGTSSTIADVMITQANFEDDDIRDYDKMAAAGFVFDNDPIGIDSIAYGGLKK